MEIAILIYPRFTALDAVGPYEVLSRLPGAKVTFVAEHAAPQRTDTTQLAMLADATIEELPHPEIVLVPGGPGPGGSDGGRPDARMAARRRTRPPPGRPRFAQARLILAAAGLLDGKRATSNWQAIEQLRALGVEVVPERVVFDGKIVTSAGVTAGIDMALSACRTHRAATRWRRRSSWGSSTTRSRRSTPARPRRRLPRSWRPCAPTRASNKSAECRPGRSLASTGERRARAGRRCERSLRIAMPPARAGAWRFQRTVRGRPLTCAVQWQSAATTRRRSSHAGRRCGPMSTPGRSQTRPSSGRPRTPPPMCSRCCPTRAASPTSAISRNTPSATR